MHTALVLVFCASSGFMAPALDFGSSFEALRFSGFRSRGARENGELEWELSSATATVRGILAELEDIELLFHFVDGDTVQIRSPRCFFNQTTKTGQSDAPLQVRSRTLELDGIGYDVRAGEQHLRVRHQVRMKLRQMNDRDALRLENMQPAGPAPEVLRKRPDDDLQPAEEP